MAVRWAIFELSADRGMPKTLPRRDEKE